VEDTTAEIIIGIAGFISLAFYLIVGKWSDRVGRKKPIIWGNVLILFLLFPVFWGLGSMANPKLSATAQQTPIELRASLPSQQCDYDPFAESQTNSCAKLQEDLTNIGIPYKITAAEGDDGSDELQLYAGKQAFDLDEVTWDDSAQRKEQVQAFLSDNGYDFADQTPPVGNLIAIIGLLLVLGALSAANYGSVAALLSEMFPPKIRYSSMSIPYHFGAGYFGGFLPLIAGYIVARTGDLFAGLWYTWIFILIATIVAWWGLKPGKPTEFTDD